jgi:hypothetical protein
MKGNWNYPTRVWAGPGRVAELPRACEELGIVRPLIVTDVGLKDSPMIRHALSLLPTAKLFADVRGNPVAANQHAEFLPSCRRPVAQDVDDLAVGVAHEEAAHAPRLVGERVDDGAALRHRTRVAGIHIAHLDADVRLRCRLGPRGPCRLRVSRSGGSAVMAVALRSVRLPSMTRSIVSVSRQASAGTANGEVNGEAIGFDAVGRGYFTLSDSSVTQPLRYFPRTSNDGPPTEQALVEAGATWQYLDKGTDQGTAWRAQLFDSSSWSNGVARAGRRWR